MNTITKELEVDFECVCEKCGAGIDELCEIKERRGRTVLQLTPCENCISKLNDEISELKEEIERLSSSEF